MLREMIHLLESLATFFSFERSFPSVYSLVLLQITRRSGGVVALVTLKWFLSRMCPHVLFHVTWGNASIAALVTLVWLFFSMLNSHLAFKITSCDAGKLANCATVKFFSRVCPFVRFQGTWGDCWIFTFIALIRFLPSVFQNMYSKISNLSGWVVALGALVWFLPSVNERVGLQDTSPTERFFALGALVIFASNVGLFMSPKATTACKILWTLVTRFEKIHLWWTEPSSCLLGW